MTPPELAGDALNLLADLKRRSPMTTVKAPGVRPKAPTPAEIDDLERQRAETPPPETGYSRLHAGDRFAYRYRTLLAQVRAQAVAEPEAVVEPDETEVWR